MKLKSLLSLCLLALASAASADEFIQINTDRIGLVLRAEDGGRLYHLDLYRIAGAAEALAFGVEEFLDDPESLALIEWPERITSLLPDNAVSVMITHLSPECREITVTK